MQRVITGPQRGQPRSPLRTILLQGNVLWLSLVSLLNDAASEIIYPLLPLFLMGQLGAGPAFVGLIEGAAESVSSFLKLASGWISDRIGRRKPAVLWGYAIASFARPLIAVATAPWHVFAIRFMDRIGKGVRSAPRDALIAGSVAAEQRGIAFGFHRAADHAGAVLGPLIGTVLLLLVFDGRLRPVFAFAAIPGLIAVLVVLVKVHEVAPLATAPAATSTYTPSPGSVRDLGASFFRYLAVLLVFTLGNASDAFLLIRANELGVAVALVPLLWGLHHVSKMLWSVVGGTLADRFGPRPAIVGGWLVYAATYVAFAHATTEWHAWALFMIYGSFYGLTEAPEKTLVAALAPPHRRGAAFGAYHFTIGLGALPASLLFGVLWETFGPRAAFLTGAALALLAAALLPLLVRAREANA